MSKIATYEVIPSAHRLIRSLRDIGYNIASAVADLIDNSIAAKASLVSVDVFFKGDGSYVCITDNGNGMDRIQLIEAMRFGSEKDYDLDDLGKFGLGLKTASLSQCQKLVVSSRNTKQRASINAFCWDLDHIEKTNKWEVLELSKKDLNLKLIAPLKKGRGTVVYWERLDRVLGYKHPYGESAKKRLVNMCREIEAHLAMVFHRFIEGEVNGKKVTIMLNGNKVQPWDPFSQQEEKTKILKPQKIRLEIEDKVGHVIIEPFVLPTMNDFSSSEAFNKASGPANWNQQQGFYFYRCGRLIQSGGWSRIRINDEHTKLARIAISFTQEMDEAFSVNVAKMRVLIPAQLKERLEEIIRPVLKLADETYRKKEEKRLTNILQGKKSTTDNDKSINLSINSGVSNQEYKTTDANRIDIEPRKMWTIDEIQEKLESIADVNQKNMIRKLFIQLKRMMTKEGTR
jgi:hypothetical protein